VEDCADLPGGLRLRLRLWTPDDLDLMTALNTPEMTDHLGGQESEAKTRARLRSYVTDPADPRPHEGAMFVIEVGAAAAVGSIGFWPLRWAGQDICETGWAVLPSYQGLGIATAAAGLVIARARQAKLTPTMHAFPSVDHPASNAVCRKSGFTLIGPAEFEYPKDHLMKVNDCSIST
jgi:RimJ/RimL family protein N-acetyltransferase